jgi:HK97 family phage prohead protease
VVALWNHDPNWVLGRQSNQTLVLQETAQGLDGEVTLDGADAMHQHFARRVERRDVQGSSFGFETVRDEWQYNDDGTADRTLLEVKLFDVSPVTYPAYPDSDAEARSLVDLATVRSGLDVGALAALLRAVEHGKVPQERAPEVRQWLARLEGILPPAPVPPIDWGRRLALRERSL